MFAEMFADNVATPAITHKANKLPMAHFLVLDLDLRCSVCWYSCSFPKTASGVVRVGTCWPSSPTLLRWEFASKSDCDGWMTMPLLACCSRSGWSSPSDVDGRDSLQFRLMLRVKDIAFCRLIVRWVGSAYPTAGVTSWSSNPDFPTSSSFRSVDCCWAIISVVKNVWMIVICKEIFYEVEPEQRVVFAVCACVENSQRSSNWPQ